MKRARRTDIYNRKAIIEQMVERGLARSLAEPLTGDMQLLIPLLIRELGVAQINQILKRDTAELHLGDEPSGPH